MQNHYISNILWVPNWICLAAVVVVVSNVSSRVNCRTVRPIVLSFLPTDVAADLQNGFCAKLVSGSLLSFGREASPLLLTLP